MKIAAGRPFGMGHRGSSILIALIATVVLAGCGNGRPEVLGSAATQPLVVDAAFPVALIAERDGTLLYGERLTGRIRRVQAGGALDADPIATVATSAANDDQRGLLGLVRDPSGRLFAAWTRADDGRIVVGEVQAGPGGRPLTEPRLVWSGPPSAQLANGAHLAFSPDGRIVIGIGDLQSDQALADDPTVPNRKMLTLDPDGPPDQKPTILSTGWNNPFAFAFSPDGTLWVADNTGGDGTERIGRGDQPARDAVDLGRPGNGAIAPSVLVAFDAGRLGLCGFISGRMQLVRIKAGRPTAPTAAISDTCSTGGTVLADGRVVTATPTEIRIRGAVGAQGS